ncbi:MAG: SDR family oxidoreductase, partial [Hyphomonadaceae bacterium]
VPGAVEFDIGRVVHRVAVPDGTRRGALVGLFRLVGVAARQRFRPCPRARAEQAEAVIREIQPWPDRGEPHHVADTVLFLCSPAAAFITGESIAVDGGYLANGLLRVHPLPGAKAKADYAGITYGLTGRPRDVRRLV